MLLLLRKVSSLVQFPKKCLRLNVRDKVYRVLISGSTGCRTTGRQKETGPLNTVTQERTNDLETE